MIKNLVEIELGYINTNHPDFIGGKHKGWVTRVFSVVLNDKVFIYLIGCVFVYAIQVLS